MLIRDNDLTGYDNIGSYEININDIIGQINKYGNYRYIDIYGASRNKKDKIHNLMNENAEIGSAWNGRILLRIDHKPTDTPIISKVDIKDENEFKLAESVKRTVMWTVHAKLYCAYYLPKEYDTYSVKISIQDTSMLFSKKKAINQFINWDVVSSLQYFSISSDKEDLPDMFFYLLNKDDVPVCFQRIKCSSFHLNHNIMIIKLFPEPCYNKVKSTINSGLLKIKIVLYNTTTEKAKVDLNKFRDGDSGDEANQNQDLEANIGIIGKLSNLYTVVCNVYMCRYLMSSDGSGTNDPYVRISCVDNQQQTSIKHQTINGIWNEKLVFDGIKLDLKRKSTWPILLAEVLDYNRIIKDNLLGSSYVWLSDSPYRYNSVELIKPKWHQLYLPKSNSPLGEILLSFYIFDDEHRHMIKDLNPIPKTIPYSFEINILGLRDIKPLAMLPIKKAYIKFDMNSLNVTGDKEDNLAPKITQPKDKGSNPTINSALKFELNLPESSIFMPQLQCEVYDYIFSGMVNPTLGLFLLNIQQLIKETNKQIEEDQKVIKTKIAHNMGAGVITNQIGAIGQLDKIVPQNNEDNNIINTSNNLNDINQNNNEINNLQNIL